MRRDILWAVVITYLILSFVPAIGLMSLMGKGKRGGTARPGM